MESKWLLRAGRSEPGPHTHARAHTHTRDARANTRARAIADTHRVYLFRKYLQPPGKSLHWWFVNICRSQQRPSSPAPRLAARSGSSISICRYVVMCSRPPATGHRPAASGQGWARAQEYTRPPSPQVQSAGLIWKCVWGGGGGLPEHITFGPAALRRCG
jgi:hypothetical protein